MDPLEVSVDPICEPLPYNNYNNNVKSTSYFVAQVFGLISPWEQTDQVPPLLPWGNICFAFIAVDCKVCKGILSFRELFHVLVSHALH